MNFSTHSIRMALLYRLSLFMFRYCLLRFQISEYYFFRRLRSFQFSCVNAFEVGARAYINTKRLLNRNRDDAIEQPWLNFNLLFMMFCVLRYVSWLVWCTLVSLARSHCNEVREEAILISHNTHNLLNILFHILSKWILDTVCFDPLLLPSKNLIILDTCGCGRCPYSQWHSA